MQLDRYLIGSSYYPEQWDPEQWPEDFRKMREIGFNVVRMGEFAWWHFEPEPGKFTFDWMDRALEEAGKQGISALLCTPTASIPAWLHAQHPETLGGNTRGAFTYGGRKGYCVNSPRLLEAVDRIVTALADRYGDHPNVLGWQIDNEPGHPFVCFDARCAGAFRAWLQARHQTLDRLNDAWGTSFWSNVYTDWGQIALPVNIAEGNNPGLELDYRRFFSDSFFHYLERQVAILRPAIGGRFVTTNWPNVTWSVDAFKAASLLDVTAWDNYCPDPGVGDPRDQFYSGFNHDLARNAGPNQRFLIAEQKTQVEGDALPAGVRLQTLINLAHGASGNVFFEWRPPLGGAEQGYVSVLQRDGTFGPAAAHCRQVSEELARVGPLLSGAKTEADVGLLFCYENQWQQGFWSGEGGYDAEAMRWYKGLKSLRRDIDVVSPDADFARYRLLAAPRLQNVSEGLAQKLSDYVRGGGVLALGQGSGTRDGDNRLHPLLPPGVLSGLAGVTIASSASAKAMIGNPINHDNPGTRGIVGGYGVRFTAGPVEYRPATTLERLDLHGAEALAEYCGGRMAGTAAVTVHGAGSGECVYVGADSRDLGFYEALFRLLGARRRIGPLLDVPDGVEVTRRVTADHEFLFLLNLTEEAQVVPLAGTARDLLRQAEAGPALTLAPLDAAILQYARGLTA